MHFFDHRLLCLKQLLQRGTAVRYMMLGLAAAFTGLFASALYAQETSAEVQTTATMHPAAENTNAAQASGQKTPVDSSAQGSSSLINKNLQNNARSSTEDDDWADTAIANPTFDIAIETDNSQIKTLLEGNLDLYRYRMLSDLTALELRRLLEHTEDNIRAITGTQGYFTPEINIKLIPAQERQPASELPLIQINVKQGSQTTVKEMQLQFEGDIKNRQTDLLISSQRRRLQWSWAMREGDPFTQSSWAGAKSNMLSRLTAQYYPAGRISASRAAIDPDNSTASLSITLDSGPRFYLGEYRIHGLERYSERLVRNFARLRAGDDYLQDDIIAAQQRLASSGYFDTVFINVDPNDPNPQAAEINVFVREAYYQKMTIGPGYSTDNGPRITFEYRHNELPLLGWQAVAAINADADNQKAEITLSSIPEDNYWRLVAYGKLEHLEDNDEKTTSAQARFGRSYFSTPLDRNYFVQYDKANTKNRNGTVNLQSITANVAWTWRRFNNSSMPTRGWGLGLEFGAGSTFGDTTNPFMRIYARGLRYVPLGRWRNGRLELRSELGGIIIKEGALVPSPLMFRTGGDSTVRGYSYRFIGVNEGNGITSSGKYLVVGSVEYQRPIIINQRPTAFEWATFIDTGAVSNNYKDLNLHTGVGAGVRWRSPVGPLKVDVAYGLKTEQIRLHFNIGFVF